MFYLSCMKCMPLIFIVFTTIFSVKMQAQESCFGRTAGTMPYLEYGLGTDRLGGAKMTYLDTGVLLKIVDSTKTNYKVQLSKYHSAYIPKSNVRGDSNALNTGFFLTSSWRVWGDDTSDYVMIQLPERLPYRSMQEIHPSKIVIDIFGATSNTNWVTQLKTVQEVSNVWHEQIEDDVFRVHIELNHAHHWGYSISYRNTALLIRIRRQPRSLRKKDLLIALDAGHGGSATGATGTSTGIKEKDYTLLFAKKAERYLKRKGFRVFMTRETDLDLSMAERISMLAKQDPDLMISIHLNSSSNTAVKGVSTYYRYIGFRQFTQHILDRMLELDLHNFGNIGSFNFTLSGPTEYPNCLLEIAFLSNADDEKKIIDEGFQKDVAKKIYKGLKGYLKTVKRSKE